MISFFQTLARFASVVKSRILITSESTADHCIARVSRGEFVCVYVD